MDLAAIFALTLGSLLLGAGTIWSSVRGHNWAFWIQAAGGVASITLVSFPAIPLAPAAADTVDTHFDADLLTDAFAAAGPGPVTLELHSAAACRAVSTAPVVTLVAPIRTT